MTGGSYYETHEALFGQALKAIFKLKSNVDKFTDVFISHMLAFHKLILPSLTYGRDVSGFFLKMNLLSEQINDL